MTEDKHFKDIMDELKKIHLEFPDMRFGQVVQVALDEHSKKSNMSITDKSSKFMLTALNNFHEKHILARKKNEVLRRDN